jgi:hypothetical protein
MSTIDVEHILCTLDIELPLDVGHEADFGRGTWDFGLKILDLSFWT